MTFKADALIAVIEEVNFKFLIKIPPETLSRFTPDNKKNIKNGVHLPLPFFPSKSFWAILEGKMSNAVFWNHKACLNFLDFQYFKSKT